MLIVGNDVVDLGDPRVLGKAKDTRFLGRIFSEEQRAAVVNTANPDLELWQRWAAKETAYKAVSKLRGTPPTFAHRAFVVSWSHASGHESGPGLRTGSVRYDSTVVHIEAAWDRDTVHAIGWVGGGEDERPSSGLARLDEADAAWSGELKDLEQKLTPRELDAVHSRASLAVRIAARGAMAEALGVDEHRLEIVCAPGKPGRRPPAVLLDGEGEAVDVSLSHDGDWIAWAFAVEAGRPVPTPRGSTARSADS